MERDRPRAGSSCACCEAGGGHGTGHSPGARVLLLRVFLETQLHSCPSSVRLQRLAQYFLQIPFPSKLVWGRFLSLRPRSAWTNSGSEEMPNSCSHLASSLHSKGGRDFSLSPVMSPGRNKVQIVIAIQGCGILAITECWHFVGELL